MGEAANDNIRPMTREQHNQMLVDRVRGVPARPSTPETDVDPRNPVARPDQPEGEGS